MSEIWGDWQEILRELVVGTIAYLCLLLLLRSFGKRALAKMNAYDFITTIALGSALASAILSKDVTIVKALTAFTLLLGLQRLVAVASMRSAGLRKLLNNEPALLSRHGELLLDGLRRENITAADVEAAVRSAGLCDIGKTSAVILETDGSMSVIPAAPRDDDRSFKRELGRI